MAINIKEYSSLLIKYGIFDDNQVNKKKLFQYSNLNNDRLKKLCIEYSLKDISGNGDTLNKAINLLNWSFEQFSHTGEIVKIKDLNSLDILKHKKEGSFFCIHKSIVLNEALLSVGIKSRILSCYPHKFDCDCHVIVIAYIPELKKWINLDPSFNTFFHDIEGTPLSIMEIRNIYKKGEIPLFKTIPIEKKWVLTINGIEYSTYNQFYSVYMAKNIFRFSSPKMSGFSVSNKTFYVKLKDK